MSDPATDKSEEQPESDKPEEAVNPDDLSPEEQMALYEESLKNTDWGHQPC